MDEELLEIAKMYFKRIGEDDIKNDFLLALCQSVIDTYKFKRNYPESYTDEMIEADVNRYFERRKYDIAMTIIPELYGRIGAEGLSMLTDAGTTRLWTKQTILTDVVPIAEIV